MKTLLDIVELIKDNVEVSTEEMGYAILALDALLFFERRAINDLADGKRGNKQAILIYDAEWQETESFNRRKRAFNVSPKEYIGENNDPSNRDYQESRKFSKKILDNIINKSKKNEK